MLLILSTTSHAKRKQKERWQSVGIVVVFTQSNKTSDIPDALHANYPSLLCFNLYSRMSDGVSREELLKRSCRVFLLGTEQTAYLDFTLKTENEG